MDSINDKLKNNIKLLKALSGVTYENIVRMMNLAEIVKNESLEVTSDQPGLIKTIQYGTRSLDNIITNIAEAFDDRTNGVIDLIDTISSKVKQLQELTMRQRIMRSVFDELTEAKKKKNLDSYSVVDLLFQLNGRLAGMLGNVNSMIEFSQYVETRVDGKEVAAKLSMIASALNKIQGIYETEIRKNIADITAITKRMASS